MERILGQSRAIAVLQAAIDSDRVHHAWIFHGPVGVGKFTTAVEFAKVLLDPDATVDLAGCRRSEPDSTTATLIDRGNHPDLHVIRKEMALTSSVTELRGRKLTNIPVDLLRELMIGGTTTDDVFHDARAFLSARRGHGKVFIIDEAELLDNVGQNALLKTLEEPPDRTYIILVTTQEDQLLPTIRSRCQRVTFSPLEARAMEAWSERERRREGSPFADRGDEERAWIMSFASGAPGVALMAAMDGLDAWRRELAPMLRDLEAGKFPAELGETLGRLIDEFAAEWVKRHDNASKDMANKDGAARVFMLLAAHAQHRLRQSIEKGSDPTPWLRAIDLIRAAEYDLDANVNLKLTMENLAAQWAS